MDAEELRVRAGPHRGRPLLEAVRRPPRRVPRRHGGVREPRPDRARRRRVEEGRQVPAAAASARASGAGRAAQRGRHRRRRRSASTESDDAATSSSAPAPSAARSAAASTRPASTPCSSPAAPTARRCVATACCCAIPTARPGSTSRASSTPAEVDWRDDDVVVLATKGHQADGRARRRRRRRTADRRRSCAPRTASKVERLALRRFARVYGIGVMLPADHLDARRRHRSTARRCTASSTSAATPPAPTTTADAIAADLRAAGFASMPVDDIMRRKRTKLFMNLANVLEAACGDADTVRPVAGGAGRGRGVLRGRRARLGERRGGQRPSGRVRHAHAAHRRRAPRAAGRRGRASPAGRSTPRPTTSTARSCSSVACTACRRRSTSALQQLARELASSRRRARLDRPRRRAGARSELDVPRGPGGSGHCGSISSSVSIRICSTAQLRYHLRSAGTQYQGAVVGRRLGAARRRRRPCSRPTASARRGRRG